jgi:hypothetical protein
VRHCPGTSPAQWEIFTPDLSLPAGFIGQPRASPGGGMRARITHVQMHVIFARKNVFTIMKPFRSGLWLLRESAFRPAPGWRDSL